MKSINYPNIPTWFIAYTENAFSFGKIEVDQCMTTGLDSLEIFTNESDYKNRLKSLGFVTDSPAII